jgi:signal transduction histidine kinase
VVGRDASHLRRALGAADHYEAFLDFVHPDDRAELMERWKASERSGEPYESEHRIVVGGTIKWIRAKAELERDEHGAVVGAIGTAQDITERKRLEAELRRAVEERDEVLGIVAHDLRGPLSTIVMAVGLLRRSGEAERRSNKPGDMIHRAAYRMNRLIDDLVDVTRMEAGKLAVDRIDVPTKELVAESIAAHEELASAAGIELRLAIEHDLPDVRADRDRLLQVLQNLIGNAIKFTPQGGCVTVGAAASEGTVTFWVKDDGSGISAEDLPHVFDRFWQARMGRRQGRKGAGLGLPIAKGIVEAHGGRLTVESTPGRGTSFSFTIPASPSAAIAGTPPIYAKVYRVPR